MMTVDNFMLTLYFHFILRSAKSNYKIITQKKLSYLFAASFKIVSKQTLFECGEFVSS